MTLAPPAQTLVPSADALAPLRLPEDMHLSPHLFAAVCAANPEAVLELTADSQLIHMTPTGGETGSRNQTLGAQLGCLLIPEKQAVEVWPASLMWCLQGNGAGEPPNTLCPRPPPHP